MTGREVAPNDGPHVRVTRGAFTGNVRLYVDGHKYELEPSDAVTIGRGLMEAGLGL